ncbi:Zn-dependent exopeptidase [Metschnikowia bicuspidata var. bicuspidata NRRL YB-4993]|uniref:Zn-dependent exopeptidase n=1 Tax=Metschnikowia bicuspidata var. bicuspidata NRRL YB-4993 TaxID=869754 RepID=A0A1A0HE94_9ASCO|nr:Zn-dependent exopeptidase [Metschnikowia bicuspidata var. bicuspidata NRRL YB-4993]OBA22310.1 Zn-dependent exopeptidase [Metschnikowia bicuspidata var. bicuspidata NRRL YB-4993]
MPSSYSRLATDTLPSQPPAYEDGPSYSHSPADAAQTPPFEQFEIDEDEVYEPAKRGSLFQRLEFRSKQVIYTFKDRVVAPLIYMLTPLGEAYKYIALRYEQAILKIGNPLVVKRLLYVIVVTVVINVIPISGNSDGVNGSSGGTFSSGKFYDIDKLGDTLRLFIHTKTLKENIEYLSSMPHLAGSTGDLALARYVESYFSYNGVSEIDFHELDSFLNFPKRDGTYLKLADDSYEATLYEDSGDKMQDWAFNPNSPSSDGEIHAPYLYVGGGSATDFARLLEGGIDMKGSVLVINYGGGIPEANKVAEAEKHGAKAVVFVTPIIHWAGTEREDSIQKVNVGLTRHSPGDVLTPGWSSHDTNSPRLSWSKSAATAKIPCIPVSFKDGQQLLQRLGQKGVQFEDNFWSGSNSASDMVKLRVSQEERSTHLIWNVVGSISGREQADKGIIFGAPRDSVGYGATTSASSTAVLLELVKAFTSLQRRFDWKPARSIHFVSFDASEYNLAGSAEWVESRKKKLQEEGYTYIEVSDIHVGDILSVTANPLLHDLIKDELKKVELPGPKLTSDTKLTLYDLYRELHGGNDKISNNFLQTKDFIPFINYLNIPTLDIGFRAGDDAVPKHSCLDTFSNFEKIEDSLMLHHVAIVELLARIGLRLAEEPLIPFQFGTLTDTLKNYKKDLENFSDTVISGMHLDVVPQMQYDSLHRGLERLANGAGMIDGFRKDWTSFIRSSSSLEPVMLAAARRSANNNMLKFNRVFLSTSGIPDRPGYLNFLFGVPYDAPEQDDTYEWNTFPMIRDYVMKGEFEKAQFEISRISALLEDASRVILTL